MSRLLDRAGRRLGPVVRAPLALVLLASVMLLSDAASAQSGPRIAPGPLLVSVRSAIDDKPMVGALVHLGGRFAATAAAGEVVFDGVPAGEYRLVVEHPDAARLERAVTLTPGRREPLVLVMEAAPVMDVKGTVVLADAGLPVPGARIVLSPVAVAASVQGSFSFAADWAGHFEILDVPVGTYRAQVSLPGCQEGGFEVQVGAGMEPLVFGLDRAVEPADLELELRDAVSGQPVVGAQVILAEAWPLGEIAAASSGPDGRVAFGGLKLGRINWADVEGRLAVARRRATVRVEREGYEPAVHLVSLRSGATAQLDLNPDTEITEREPNGELGTAQPIRSGAPVHFQIATRGDEDWFVLRLDEPAHLRIEVGPKNPIQIEVVVLDGQGKRVASHGTHAGKTNVIARGFLAGQYYLRITEWGNDGASPDS